MLLIIEALLLILAALGQDHSAAAAGQICPLDMALDSVDDQALAPPKSPGVIHVLSTGTNLTMYHVQA
ncbi:unnamed protein product [Leuciscus chuanchicus]